MIFFAGFSLGILATIGFSLLSVAAYEEEREHKLDNIFNK